jgi:hypothetical protein
MDSLNELKTSYPNPRKRKQPLSADERSILQQHGTHRQSRQNLISNSRVAAAAKGALPPMYGVATYAADKVYDATKTAAKATVDAVSRAGSAAMTPAPAPTTNSQTVIHHHYHQAPGSERTVSQLLSNIGSDAARDVGSKVLTGAVLAGSAIVGRSLADRKKKRQQLEPRPAEARGGHPDAPRPGSADGQLPAGADEPTRPPPRKLMTKARLAIMLEELEKLR